MYEYVCVDMLRVWVCVCFACICAPSCYSAIFQEIKLAEFDDKGAYKANPDEELKKHGMAIGQKVRVSKASTRT